MKKPFRRHFRIYLKNNHPAYFVDEEGNIFVFHRVTHSKSSGGKKTWEKKNPIKDGDKRNIHIVKQEQRDKKNKFSYFEIELLDGADVSYPEIKKAGGSQTNHGNAKVVNNVTTSKTGNHQAKHDYFIGRSRYESSTHIKTKKHKKHKANKKEP